MDKQSIDKPGIDKPIIEKRSEPRFEVNAPVILTELGQRRMQLRGGLVEEISGSGMRVKLSSAIDCGTPVKVETQDMLMLGEVVRCEGTPDGFHVGLILRHSLQDLPALAKLNRALMGELGEDRAEKPAIAHLPRLV